MDIVYKLASLATNNLEYVFAAFVSIVGLMFYLLYNSISNDIIEFSKNKKKRGR